MSYVIRGTFRGLTWGQIQDQTRLKVSLYGSSLLDNWEHLSNLSYMTQFQVAIKAQIEKEIYDLLQLNSPHPSILPPSFEEFMNDLPRWLQ